MLTNKHIIFKGVFLSFTFLIALLVFYFGLSKDKGGEPVKLSEGTYVFLLSGSANKIIIDINKYGYEILTYDESDNSDSIKLKNGTKMISSIRSDGDNRITVVDNDGDGIADFKVIYNGDDDSISKHILSLGEGHHE